MKKIAGIAGGLIGLRLVGIIHDIWLVVGLVALVLFWEFLVSQFPNYKKLINWGLGALLAVSLVTTVGHNIYISHVKPNIPFSSAASERALIGADLEATLRISPSMLDSRTALAGHLQEVQKHLGAQHYASLQKIQQQLTAGDLTTQEAWEKTQLILEEEQEYRAKMQNATDQLSAVRSPRSSGSKLALVGILLLLIAFIPKALPIPGKKACGGIGIALIVIVLILWALPGIKTATASVAGGIGGMFNSSSTPDQRGANVKENRWWDAEIVLGKDEKITVGSVTDGDQLRSWSSSGFTIVGINGDTHSYIKNIDMITTFSDAVNGYEEIKIAGNGINTSIVRYKIIRR